MARELLFRGFKDGRASFTGLRIDQVITEYHYTEIKEMDIVEWTGVVDWRGINIYNGDIVHTWSKHDSEIKTGTVQYEPQLCRYIIKLDNGKYKDLNDSAQTGTEYEIKMDNVEVCGNVNFKT